ncbi:MAG: alpha/beta hydrolase [Oxalobacteraceae bacterium]|jgi:pimeloyl-ACP methyl ester carboxylesterase|nr:alpha/beta hydrolase [Oxalobacteraceae bacterium]
MTNLVKAMIVLLFAGIVACVYLLWTPDKDPAHLLEKYAQSPSAFTTIAGTKLHYRDSGPKTAPVLVFLHGFGSSLHTWDTWAAALDKDYRVIRLDLPGFGLSGENTENDFSDSHDLAVIMGLLDTLHINKASFIGNSLGGKLAWQIAYTYPERVEKLILISPDGFASEGFEYNKQPDSSFMLNAMVWTLPKPALKMNLLPAYADPNSLTTSLLNRYHDLMCAPGVRKSIATRVHQTLLKDPVPMLKSIRADTLLIWGERDAMIPVANAKDYMGAIATSRLVVLPDIGHLPQEEQPQLGLLALQKFLQP